MDQNKRVLYILLIILQGFIYGLGNPLGKIAYESITPFWCLAVRFLLASVIMLAFFGRQAFRELRQVRFRNWLPSSLCMAGAYITCNLALNTTAATTVGFLMSLSVVFTPILVVLVLHRPYRLAVVPAQLAAVIGLYLLCSNGNSFHFGWGEGLSVLCSLFMAGSLVWGEDSLDYMSPLTITVTQILVTTVLSFAGAFLLEPVEVLRSVQPTAWWIIIYLALLCSCVSYIIQNVALAHIPSGIVALTQCSEPVFTAAASFMLLGERLSLFGWTGAALIMGCIVYGNYIEMKLNLMPT